MRIWRLHDYLFVKPSREQRATGGPRDPYWTRGFIRSAGSLTNSIEFQGRFASESACADYLSSAVGREGA
jgi:hypothetical protein